MIKKAGLPGQPVSAGLFAGQLQKYDYLHSLIVAAKPAIELMIVASSTQ